METNVARSLNPDSGNVSLKYEKKMEASALLMILLNGCMARPDN